MRSTERFDAIVVGGGNAGLAAGYFLQERGADFVILDAGDHVGDSWRRRWDSLRLFTPARYTQLPGMPLSMDPFGQPTKDEMADYMEAYAERFAMPVRTGVRVERLERRDGRYVLAAAGREFESARVIVATGANRDPRIPAFSRELDPAIMQLHSSEYRNPSQLRDGSVLVVGAGNSGADIARELAKDRAVWLSGPDRGHIPFDIDRWFARHIAFRIVRFIAFHVLTIRTPMGRRVRERLRIESKGDPLVRVKPRWLAAAGVERVPRAVGTAGGHPEMEDGTVLDVDNVVWCTGSRQDLSWIDLPIFDGSGEVQHDAGVVMTEPGMGFVGLPFQFAFASEVLPGMNRDARSVVQRLMSGSATERKRAVAPA